MIEYLEVRVAVGPPVPSVAKTDEVRRGEEGGPGGEARGGGAECPRGPAGPQGGRPRADPGAGPRAAAHGSALPELLHGTQ